ncbi:MAG TPA: hypothetical protein VNN74_03485 [Candidatus Micrarchaeia archaeon]|nr:hypothetical protein [Candidatus Micrarchaeia archaeon]
MTTQPPALPAGFPELRNGPPWLTEEMVAAEPGLVEPICRQGGDAGAVADLVRRALAADEPVAVVGCGTSEHAAMAVAALLRDALGARERRGRMVASRQAFEAALDPWPGLCLAISHEAGTRATLAALDTARARGAATALVTAAPDGPCAARADQLVTTPLVDRAWCHTVGYLSPILAGAVIASRLSGNDLDAAALRQHLERTSDAAASQARPVAAALADTSVLECAGSGVDAITARELALKVEEGVRRPAVGRDLETVLHGHLVARDRLAGLVVVATEPRASERRLTRAAQLLAAATRIGVRTAAIVAADAPGTWAADATTAGRLVVPRAPGVPPLLAALAGSAMALQRLTLALVAAAGTNPDLIRREEMPYREAAVLAESSFPG